MTSATDDSAVRPATGGPHKRRVIDCDIHEQMLTHMELVPYARKPWSDWISNWQGLYFAEHVHPLGGSTAMRAAKVTLPGKQGRPGVDYDLMCRDHLDKYQIDYGILTSFFYPIVMRTQTEFATAVAAAYNDWLIENWLERDARLLGSIQIAPQDPLAAAAEIDRVGQHKSMVQVMLPLAGSAFGEPQFRPIFEAAARNHIAVAMHQSSQTVSPVGMMRHYIEWHTALPSAFQAQVISLIYNGIFDSFPDLQVVCLEGGFTWVPSLMWRMDQQFKSLHVEIPWAKRMPSEVIRNNFKFASQPMEDITSRELMMLLEMAGGDDWIVWASDYPHWDYDEPMRTLPAGLPAATVNKVMYSNAAGLYQLK